MRSSRKKLMSANLTCSDTALNREYPSLAIGFRHKPSFSKNSSISASVRLVLILIRSRQHLIWDHITVHFPCTAKITRAIDNSTAVPSLSRDIKSTVHHRELLSLSLSIYLQFYIFTSLYACIERIDSLFGVSISKLYLKLFVISLAWCQF